MVLLTIACIHRQEDTSREIPLRYVALSTVTSQSADGIPEKGQGFRPSRRCALSESSTRRVFFCVAWVRAVCAPLGFRRAKSFGFEAHAAWPGPACGLDHTAAAPLWAVLRRPTSRRRIHSRRGCAEKKGTRKRTPPLRR